MTKEQYIELFLGLGFYNIEIAHTLKHRRSIPSLYFNSNREVGVYFTGYPYDRHTFSRLLWDDVPAHLVKKKDVPGHINIVPKAGRERAAFMELLA